MNRVWPALKTCGRVLVRSVKRFQEERGLEEAAANAYFTLLSLFPLLLLAVTVASFFFQQEGVRAEILSFVTEYLPPNAKNFVKEDMRAIIRGRGSMGVVGFSGTLWAASNVFRILAQNCARAWKDAHTRNIIWNRVVSFALVGGVIFAVGVVIVLESITAVLFRIGGHIPIVGALPLWSAFSRLAGIPVIFGILWLFYRYIPTVPVRWRDAFWGAAAAVLFLGLFVEGFGLFATLSFERYSTVYGSLGTIVLFMFWSWGIHAALIWSAHVTAAVQYCREHRGK